MKNLLNTLFGIDAEFLTQFEQELYSEMKDYFEYKKNKESLKEVSPPDYSNKELDVCKPEGSCCCGGNCTCNKNKEYDTTEYDVTTNANEGEFYDYPIPSSVEVDGWTCELGNSNMPLWYRDVVVPVEKQYASVNVLEGDTVHVAYEKRVVLEDENAYGSHLVSGSHSYPLPTFANPLTLKAKFVSEGILRLSVEEQKLGGASMSINIEG